jgi:hypothetical protein
MPKIRGERHLDVLAFIAAIIAFAVANRQPKNAIGCLRLRPDI